MPAPKLLALWLLPLGLACAPAVMSSSGNGGGGQEAVAEDAGELAAGEDAGMDLPIQEEPLQVQATQAVPVVDPRHGPPYPVVLVHGLNGFRDLGPVGYFFQVPGALEEAGEEVYVTAVAPYDGTPDRANMLSQEIDRILLQSRARKLNIIAHSQGGLDSRWLISKLGYGDRIASLTTISTPHRGTRVADVLSDADFPGRDAIINAYAWLFGELSRDAANNPDARDALLTLSSAHAEAFNKDIQDDPRVAYFSWAGRTNLQQGDNVCGDGERPNPGAVDAIEPALLATWTLLAGDLLHPAANDGLVSVESAKWGRFMGCLPADHADEIGQLADLLPELVSGWDHKEFYTSWVAWLRTQGL